MKELRIGHKKNERPIFGKTNPIVAAGRLSGLRLARKLGVWFHRTYGKKMRGFADRMSRRPSLEHQQLRRDLAVRYLARIDPYL